MTKLLVIDDDDLILDSFHLAFAEPEYTLVSKGTAAEGLATFDKDTPDVAIIDIRLPDMSGLELFEKLHEIDSKVPIVLMTGHGTAGTAIEAMRAGAFDYLLKPLDLDALFATIESAAETSRMMRVPATVADDVGSDEGDILIGNCPAMQEVYRSIGRVAPQNVTVLILGESGTGKEVVARAIYNYSQRAKDRFLAINCAAIPEQLMESELFGHEKGAFTGADRQRVGKFELCDKGTLFLDEIGDMTPLMQTKVLRVLQDQTFERVGGNESITTDARLIAATNRNLEEMIEAGDFRSDLFYRLNDYVIELPPLRERGDDIPLLIKHFVRRTCSTLGKDVAAIPDETMSLLRAYSWPGNVRELQSVVKRALVEATSPVLLPECLPSSIRQQASPTSERTSSSFNAADITDWDAFVSEAMDTQSTSIHEDAMRVMERQIITRVLRHTDGNQVKAANALGITRTTLRTKIKQYGIAIGRVVDES